MRAQTLIVLALILSLPFAERVTAAQQDKVAGKPGEGLLFLQTLDERVADVSWKIMVSNADLCPNRMYGIGIAVHNAAQYAAPYRQIAIPTFGFGDGLPAILAVSKGSPAEIAGLRKGDRIVSIDSEPVIAHLPSKNAPENYASINAIMTKLETLPKKQIIRFGISRGGPVETVVVNPVEVCRSRVEVVPSPQINANSNGLIVQIFGKLALWTRSDDELAIVIAHEMAHNVLSHNQRIEREGIGTGIFASLGRDGRKLRGMERDADRYGLFMVARAGYDYRRAPEFWHRLSGSSGLGGIWATTHPSASNRAEFNRGVVAEIEAKRRAGDDLTP